MNDRFLLNIFKIVFSFIIYYSGIFFILKKVFLRKGFYVFNYHGLNTFVNDFWRFGSLFFSNYKQNFEKQIQFFDKYLNKPENFDLKSIYYEKSKYILTFDDGYKDNFDIVFPLLKKYSIPSIFFITTSVIGEDKLLWYDRVRHYYEDKEKKNILDSARLKRQCKNKLSELKQRGYLEFISSLKNNIKSPPKNVRLMMNWDEIREVYNSGIMIGSHTHTHPILTQLNFNQQKQEIESSIGIINKHLDYLPITFAYPEGVKGSFNNDTINILRKFGIKYAFTTVSGVNTELTSPFCLKRIAVNPSEPIPVLALKLVRVVIQDKFKNNLMKELKVSIEQYGLFNSFRRLGKKFFGLFGLHFETYYILHRSLGEEIKLFDLSEEIEVKRITYKDFEESEFFYRYPQSKKNLYKERFSNKACQAFGVTISDNLVYMTWIGTDFLRIERIHLEQKLKKGEGVLVDSYALPEARRLGIHQYMNGYRLEQLKEKGVNRVYAAVLAENIPALKTQIKHEFKQGEKITWIKLGKLEKYYRKQVNFK